MKRIIFAVAGVAILCAAALVASVWVEVRRPAVSPGHAAGDSVAVVRFEVGRGASFSSVVTRLHEQGLVRRPWALEWYARVGRVDRHIHRGTYAFTWSESPRDILGKLVSGDVLKVEVTIPEGYTIWEIAAAFTSAGVDSAAMVAAMTDETRRAERHIKAPSLEGYLFPDTYTVPFGVAPGEVVSMMLARLDEVYTPDLLTRTAEIGMTPHEALTMASIIEAEAQVPAERPIVSAVYHNRLKKHMRLEADPTVAYAMGGYRGRLLYADLEIESPYNTYRNGGLPPGPICSAGAAALHAALYPDTTTTALYFVARGDGSHIFSQTLAEHRRNVRNVRRLSGRP